MVRKVSLAIAATFAAGCAMAQSDSTTETVTESKGYLGVVPYYLSADEDRLATDDGRGLAVLYGRNWTGGWFWEAQTFGGMIETGVDGLADFYQYGAGLDVGYRFRHDRERWSPYILLGAGVIRNDVVPETAVDNDWFGNAALGFTTGALGKGGVTLRGEARYIRDRFTYGPVNGMNDWRYSLGVTVPLGRRSVERETIRERVVTETVTVPQEARIVDSDNDGVPDQIDQCPGTLEGLATDNRGCASQSGGEPQALRLDDVNFELNSATLTAGSRATLQRVAEALRGEPNLRAEIAGHTDSSGADDYNMRLSQQRADAVLTWLVGEGIERNRLQARGYGETQPVADNGTADGRARNRRVEFRVLN